jgi:hypothetical protein
MLSWIFFYSAGSLKQQSYSGKFLLVYFNWYRIDGVMVSVLASSAGDRGFEPRSSIAKGYKIGICCFSVKHAA